jgi:protein phosphatase
MIDPNQDTVTDVEPQNFAQTFFAPQSAAVRIDFAATTHTGRVRTTNEDQYAIVRRTRSTDVILSSLAADEIDAPDDVSYGLAVADGIGGAQSGEVASRLAIQFMLELSGHATSWIMKFTDLEAQQIRERVEAYLQRVQQMLLQVSRSHPAFRGMGTTWTSAHVFPGHAVIVHLGDSRAYLFRHDHLLQITHDETVAQAWINAGIAPEKVRRVRHILVNSLGGDRGEVTAQVHQIDFGPGDKLLLCSDGLYDMVPDADIAKVLSQAPTTQAAVDTLLDKALQAGGRDNITIVLAAAE